MKYAYLPYQISYHMIEEVRCKLPDELSSDIMAILRNQLS